MSNLNSSQEQSLVLLALPLNKIASFSEKLKKAELPVRALAFPVLELKADRELAQSFDWEQLPKFSWLILSSSFGAQSFFEFLPKELPANLKIAVVGPSVAEVVQAHGYKVALQPQQFNSGALKEALLKAENPQGKAFLSVSGPQSALGELELALENAGATVEKLEVYQAWAVDKPEWEALAEFSASEAPKKIICFSSPEGVKAFYKLLTQKPHNLASAVCVCLGPATTEKVQKLFPGWKAHCAPEYSYNGMVELLVNLTAP